MKRRGRTHTAIDARRYNRHRSRFRRLRRNLLRRPNATQLKRLEDKDTRGLAFENALCRPHAGHVFIQRDRYPHSFPDFPGRLELSWGNRLLDILDIELAKPANGLDRLVDSPGAVRIEAQL